MAIGAKSMDLVNDPIPKLVRQIAIPASVGMIFYTLFNVVDTFWAGRFSTEGLAALSLSFPMFFLVIAFGMGASTGATALISNALGKRDERMANVYLKQALTLSLLIGLFIAVGGWFAAKPLARFLHAKGEILDYATAYARIVYVGSVLFILNYTLSAALNSRGDTKGYRNVLIVAFVLNIGLDPLLMYGYAPLRIPAMGVPGVAVATVAVQAIGVVYLFKRTRKIGLFKDTSLRDFIPQARVFREIGQQGIPAGINMMTVAIGIFVITYFIGLFEFDGGAGYGIAGYGVAVRIEQIALLPTAGLQTALLALAGQNTGAGRMDRVKESYTTVLLYGALIMVVMLGALFILPRQLAMLFTSDPAVVNVSVSYIYIAAPAFYAYVLLFNGVSVLQGMKKPMFALWIGIYRQVVAPGVAFWLLGSVMGLGINGIWWGVLVVTWSAALYTAWYTRRVLKGVESVAVEPLPLVSS